jgi:hypothetical protein
VRISSEIPQVPAAPLALALVSVPAPLRRERGSGTDTNIVLLGAAGRRSFSHRGLLLAGTRTVRAQPGGLGVARARIDMNTMATM